MAKNKYKPSVTIQGLHTSKKTYQGNMTKAILIGPLSFGVLIALLAMCANLSDNLTDKTVLTNDIKIVDMPKGSKDGTDNNNRSSKSSKSVGRPIIPAMLGYKHEGVFNTSKMVITKDDGTRYKAHGSIVVPTTVVQTQRSSQLSNKKFQDIVDLAFIPGQDGEDYLTVYGTDDDFSDGLPGGEITFFDPQFDNPININFGDIDGSEITPLIPPDHGVLVNKNSVFNNQPTFKYLKPSQDYAIVTFYITIDKEGRIVKDGVQRITESIKGVASAIEDVMYFWKFTAPRKNGKHYRTTFPLTFEFCRGKDPVVEIKEPKTATSKT